MFWAEAAHQRPANGWANDTVRKWNRLREGWGSKGRWKIAWKARPRRQRVPARQSRGQRSALGGVDSRRPRVSVACSCHPGRRGDDAEAESLDRGNSLLIANLAQFAAFFGGMIIGGVRCTTPIGVNSKSRPAS